ncbi:MAG: polyprenyl synthetase family protein [Acidobacteria bacterium]|nr:MAG: polyprenyl synthetase family protein [Acidobacteriota bacterium]PYV05538.1 MAG: polyprenyl synthetase family protein [Acidobacteriota bacterium]PYV40235.1 MAG: polyprenyl synthetase family protein [Acidobacteriota bacterium]
MNPQEIFKLVEEGLAEVERELERHSHSNVQLVDRISRYIQDSGGKRIRPALLLLTSQMCGYQGPVVYRLGAVVEMIHAATLVHDDIIDDAKVRRGRPSVNAQWGNEITVLMGDWLYMTAFHLALRERHFKILDILTEVTRKMIEGELIQQDLNGSMDVTEEQHLDISMRKTAFLFSACAQIGGILSSVSEQHQEYLDRYGLNIGIAFQMVDDVLDFTSTESTLGKPVVSDLKEGKLTLPLIYLMQEGEPQHRELVRTVLRENGFGSVNKEAIVDLVRKYKTVDRVMDKAHQYAREAKQYLLHFPESRAREALTTIPDYIVERDR